MLAGATGVGVGGAITSAGAGGVITSACGLGCIVGLGVKVLAVPTFSLCLPY